MRKQTILLLAGGLLTFAACKNESADSGGFTQEYVDSAVNARVMELQVQMQASNDSVINALATWKADSMIAAAKGQKPTTPKPRVNNPGSATAPPPPPVEPPKPPTVQSGGLKSQSDQNRVKDKNSVQGGGLKSKSDQNKTKDQNGVQGGGLKSQSDENRTK